MSGPLDQDAAPCVIAADGHVTLMASSSAMAGEVRRMARAVQLLGIGGFRFGWMNKLDAVEAVRAGLPCEACRMMLPCGCTIPIAISGGCPHGAAERIDQVARALGFRS